MNFIIRFKFSVEIATLYKSGNSNSKNFIVDFLFNNSQITSVYNKLKIIIY